MKKILFVDDEAQILKALTRIFMDTDYEVITAASGENALKILQNEEVDMVISDMRMPNMDGYELLCKVKKAYPQIIRIILSGYSDEKIVFKALQKNIAKLYIFKPWENDKLLELITQLFETEDILYGKDLLSLINNVENLPTIKANYQQIVSLIDEDCDIKVISTEIEKDVSMSAKVLHVANSAFFGAKTGSIKQAVSYIGLQNTKSLVLSTSIIESMSDRGAAGDMIENIWKHSFVSNRLLAFLYENQLNKRIPEMYSSAGLLHNIGKIFFIKYFKEKYLKILLAADRNKENTNKMEILSFKVSHNESGGYLLKWWEFPHPIVEAALFHYNPMDTKVVNRELVCAVHIVIKYAMELLGKEWVDGLDMRAFEFLRISKTDFEASLSAFKV